MKNKILLLAIIITFSSCSVFQKTRTFTQNIDSSIIKSNDVLQKFLGTYEIEVFNLPDGGDGKFSMKVTNEGEGLKATFTTEEAGQTIDIVGTEVEEGILYIDIYIKSYGINTAFEIYVEGDQVTGYLADMFELQGVKYPLIESDENIWEIKCTSKITQEHQLQVVIYAWLWKILYPEQERTFYILNIRTGEKQTLQSSNEDLTRIVVTLLRNKYEDVEVLSDEQFITLCKNNMQKYC